MKDRKSPGFSARVWDIKEGGIQDNGHSSGLGNKGDNAVIPRDGE